MTWAGTAFRLADTIRLVEKVIAVAKRLLCVLIDCHCDRLDPPVNWNSTPPNRYLVAGTEVTKIRRRFKQIQFLEERLAEVAKRLQEEAQLLPPGAQRDAVEGKPGRQRLVLTSAIGYVCRVCSRQGKRPCRT